MTPHQWRHNHRHARVSKHQMQLVNEVLLQYEHGILTVVHIRYFHARPVFLQNAQNTELWCSSYTRLWSRKHRPRTVVFSPEWHETPNRAARPGGRARPGPSIYRPGPSTGTGSVGMETPVGSNIERAHGAFDKRFSYPRGE